jgi:hypothetical protein
MVFASPLSNDVQRGENPGARWFATYSIKTAKRAEMNAVLAFLVKLRGGANSFYGYDPAATTPLGTGSGTPVVNGASQVGSSLVTDGWGNSETVLMAGDYFTVNGEMKMVTEDVTSDSSGNATIQFEPVLRVSPPDNAAITVNTPTCKMRLIDDDQTQWREGVNGFYEISFSAIETFLS